jgi:hypothetical protein
MDRKLIIQLGVISSVVALVSSTFIEDKEKAKKRRNLSFVLAGATIVYAFVSNNMEVSELNSRTPIQVKPIQVKRIERKSSTRDVQNEMFNREVRKVKKGRDIKDL